MDSFNYIDFSNNINYPESLQKFKFNCSLNDILNISNMFNF